jgi:hypothetical protein
MACNKLIRTSVYGILQPNPVNRRGRFIVPTADLSALPRCSDVRINLSMCIIAL